MAAAASEIVPWLMLPYPLSPSDVTTRQFFRLSPSNSTTSDDDDSHHHHHQLIHLPELDWTDYHGLNHPSWLLVIKSGVKSSPFLFNPITRSQISLPPLPPPPFWNQCVSDHANFLYLSTTSDYDENHHKFLGPELYMPLIHRAVLSSSPNDDEHNNNNNNFNLEVMVLRGWDSKLFFCRPTDAHWTPIAVADDDYQKRRNTNYERRRGRSLWYRRLAASFRCLAYCNGRFYAADNKDWLVVCDTRASPPTTTALLPLPFLRKEPSRTSFFLLAAASSSLLNDHSQEEDLLLVIKRDLRADEQKRLLDEESDQVYREFQVFKLVEGGGEGEGERVEWLRLDSIGDQTIFVCRENAVAISTKDHHDSCIISPNCIYFSDLLVEKHPRAETVAVLIEFSILENKRKRVINCCPPSSLCLWQSLWFQPSRRLPQSTN